jgi:hypothetical protein
MQSSDSMQATSVDVQAIIDRARSPDRPSDWFVWPLRRDRVARSALGWGLTGLFGTVLFVPLTISTVPSNFEPKAGAGLVVFTIVLLAVIGTVAIGGLWLLVADLLRLARADQYLLIFTPADYVKVEPRRVTHVPMANVAYVTLKGVKAPPGAQVSPADDPAAMAQRTPGIGLGSLFGSRPREPGRAPSLAFLDTRTNREVVVGTDNSFDELLVLEDLLGLYAGRAGTRRP